MTKNSYEVVPPRNGLILKEHSGTFQLNLCLLHLYGMCDYHGTRM